jgi:surface antigen
MLVCGLILAQTSSAGATSLQKQTIKQDDTTVIELLSVEPTQALKVITDAAEFEEVKPAEPEETKHTVQKSESLTTIAKQYNVDWKRIYDKNVSVENPDVISVGTELVIPKQDETLEPRQLPTPPPVVAAKRKPVKANSKPVATVASMVTTSNRGSASGNLYSPGYCTWYVKNRRPDLPNNLGNAYSWVSRAAAQGIPTGSTPRVGAAAQRNNHIAYVEAVNGDGTITISDMNYQALYAITTRTVPANQWSYIY